MSEAGQSILEEALKRVLEMSVNLAKQKLKSKTQLAQLQNILTDYSSNEELILIIEKVLKMAAKVQQKNKSLDESNTGYVQQAEYVKLEESLQKYEASVRNHIKNEQQFKLYCEELEVKVKDLEASKHELVLSTKSTILSLKKQNQQLIAKIKKQQQQAQDVRLHERKRNSQSRQSDLQQKNEEKKFNGRASSLISSSNKSLKKSNKDTISKAQSNLRAKLDHYTKVMEEMDFSRSRRGSMSSMKAKEKKFMD